MLCVAHATLSTGASMTPCCNAKREAGAVIIYCADQLYEVLEANTKFFGISLIVPGLGLVLGLVQRWPRSHLGWSHGLVVNHQNLARNESQQSVYS